MCLCFILFQRKFVYLYFLYLQILYILYIYKIYIFYIFYIILYIYKFIYLYNLLDSIIEKKPFTVTVFPAPYP